MTAEQANTHISLTPTPSTFNPQSKFQEATGGRLAAVEKLQAEVQALDAVFETDRDYEHVSHKVGG